MKQTAQLHCEHHPERSRPILITGHSEMAEMNVGGDLATIIVTRGWKSRCEICGAINLDKTESVFRFWLPSTPTPPPCKVTWKLLVTVAWRKLIGAC